MFGIKEFHPIRLNIGNFICNFYFIFGVVHLIAQKVRRIHRDVKVILIEKEETSFEVRCLNTADVNVKVISR
jgi:hypothetical protein